jgi:hypothetical protein
MSFIPSEADVEALLQHGAVIRGEFRWRESGRHRFKAEAKLEDTYEDSSVRVIGTLNAQLMNLSYIVLWGTQRIRSLDIGGPPHPNPDGTVIPTPHKHRWTDRYADRVAYRPTDISSDEVEGVFHQFLAECNITFQGTYRAPTLQGRLQL